MAHEKHQHKNDTKQTEKIVSQPSTSILTKMKNLFFLLLFLITSFTAQSQFSITGAVTDQPITQVLQDARLTLFNTDTSFFRETRSDVSGNYTFSNIPANTYSIGVSVLNKEYQQILVSTS